MLCFRIEIVGYSNDDVKWDVSFNHTPDKENNAEIDKVIRVVKELGVALKKLNNQVAEESE